MLLAVVAVRAVVNSRVSIGSRGLFGMEIKRFFGEMCLPEWFGCVGFSFGVGYLLYRSVKIGAEV